VLGVDSPVGERASGGLVREVVAQRERRESVGELTGEELLPHHLAVHHARDDALGRLEGGRTHAPAAAGDEQVAVVAADPVDGIEARQGLETRGAVARLLQELARPGLGRRLVRVHATGGHLPVRPPVRVAVLPDQSDATVLRLGDDAHGVGDLEDVVLLHATVLEAQEVAPQRAPRGVVHPLAREHGVRREGRRVRVRAHGRGGRAALAESGWAGGAGRHMAVVSRAC
jgi:hypothetical protein